MQNQNSPLPAHHTRTSANRYSATKLEKHIALSSSRHQYQNSAYLDRLKQRFTNRAYRSIDQNKRQSSSYRVSPTLELSKKPRLTKGYQEKEKSARTQFVKLPEITKKNLSPGKKSKFDKYEKEKDANFQFLNQIEGYLHSNKKKMAKSPQKMHIYSPELPISVKTKAGSNGRTIKINQDIDIIDQRLPHGVKLFCICDGHGVNGHHEENLRSRLKSISKIQYIQDQLYLAFQKTNQELLESQINTELSGSTVVAVFLYKDKIYCFNVGDSRAIMINHEYGAWKAQELSKDQKPCREDQAKRIRAAGGRIQHQVNQRGEEVGPLRVWQKEVKSPGLAMTRSFGDKAGIKAGTNGQPEVFEYYIHDKHKFLLVASDGVWQHLQNHEIVKMLAPYLQENKMEEAANILLEKCISLWDSMYSSRDDITFILVGINTIIEDKK